MCPSPFDSPRWRLCSKVHPVAHGERPERLVVIVRGQPDLLEVVQALRPPRRLAPDWTAGSKRAISTAMMAMTTKSSIRVKP